MEFPPPPPDGRATQGNSLKETQWRVGPEHRLLNLHFLNICRHHPTLKFKPHATDDERYVSGIDGVPLTFGHTIYGAAIQTRLSYRLTNRIGGAEIVRTWQL